MELSQLVLQLWTCCLLCVCSLSLPDFVYPSKDWEFSVWNQGPALGGKGATKLCFLFDFSSAAGTLYRVFPPQINKISYRMVQSLLASKILINWESAHCSGHLLEDQLKTYWGDKQVGSASTYSSTIFSPCPIPMFPFLYILSNTCWFIADSHSDRSEMISSCVFNLHFCDD